MTVCDKWFGRKRLVMARQTDNGPDRQMPDPASSHMLTGLLMNERVHSLKNGQVLYLPLLHKTGLLLVRILKQSYLAYF